MAHPQSTNIIHSAVVNGRETIRQGTVAIKPGEYYWVCDVLTGHWEVGWVPRKEIEPVAKKIITLIGMIKVYPIPRDGMGFLYRIGPRIDPPSSDKAGTE